MFPREGFICPECHLDMSTIEMLQIHFEDVHAKQSSSTVKGLFSLAKQKIKSVQDNFSPLPTESIINYAQFFSSEIPKSQPMGYVRTFNDVFFQIRKDKHNQIEMETIRLLVRLARLTSTSDETPKNANTKERRKFEQEIVEWLDDSKVSLCPSCAKPFGLSRRKHHCRLDGFVICNHCSQFLPFSTARYLIEPKTPSSNGVALQRSNSLTSLTSTANADDLRVTTSEDYLRICLSCRQILQRRYDELCFKTADKEDVVVYYEQIVALRNELNQIQPTYAMMIESLLNGDAKYQINDAQKIYRRLSTCYEKIDAISKRISQLADSCSSIDEDDTPSQIRYSTLCRNIRTYAIHLLQNYALVTRKMPSEDDIKQAREERQRLVDQRMESERLARDEVASRVNLIDSPTIRSKKGDEGWRPTIDRDLLEQTHELPPLVQQVYQVTEYIRLAQIAGRYDEVESLKLNLKVLEQALNTNEQNQN